MSERPAKPVESQRRLLLRVLTKTMIAFSVVVGLWVILSPLLRNAEPVNQRVVETAIDVAEFAEGEVDIIEWFDKPLIIARRSSQQEALLESVPAVQLKDPGNKRSTQPQPANNSLRSATQGWFVAIGIGSSSGCALQYNAQAGEFTDGCDGSRYDLAGRALAGSAARGNTPVPHWRYADGKIFVSTRKVMD